MRAILRLRSRRYKRWHRRNKKLVSRAAWKRRRDREKAFIRTLRHKPCTDCGLFFGDGHMEFDHLPQFKKEFSIGDSRHRSYKKIAGEAAKCEIVCHDCHEVREVSRGRSHREGQPCPNRGALPVPWPG
jgi:hypothetical protein